MMPDWSW